MNNQKLQNSTNNQNILLKLSKYFLSNFNYNFEYQLLEKSLYFNRKIKI